MAFFLPSIWKAEVLVSFYKNRSYIEQNLCENKNEPEKQCHGCCYLAKQLKKTEEGEKSSKSSDKPGSREERSLSPYVLTRIGFQFGAASSFLMHTDAYQAFMPEAPVFALLHPPGLVA